MEDQFGMVDLRQYITGRPIFRPVPQPPHTPEFLSGVHQGLTLNPPNINPYGMLMFRSDSNNSTSNAANAVAAASGGGSGRFIAFDSGGNGTSGRWPRQETLTLLEIRSRLDSKFKESNQKGPLWDEVSRIMSEEYGYQRSGKKCREKFENLYKYYKKTREGKAGRQDGKHYRFFRQLEALYGDPYSSNNNNNNSGSASASASISGVNPLGSNYFSYPNNINASSINQEDTSLSLSNYSDAETNSSDGDSDLNRGIEDNEKSKRVKEKEDRWKVKIRDFIDGQMKKLMDKQEAWMERMMKTMEDKERERMLREEQWRKQDAARVERERELWASERAWIEARDTALMEALHKVTTTSTGGGNDHIIRGEIGSLSENCSDQTMTNSDFWHECEVNKLIQLRSEMDIKFQRRTVSEEVLWEEVSHKMPSCFGHHRTGSMCKEKWESILGKKTNQGGFHHSVRVNDDDGNSMAMNDHYSFRYSMGEYARILE